MTVKTKPLWVAALATMALHAASAEASSQMTLADLQQLCTADDDGSRHACLFYILGVTEGASTAAGVAGDKAHFCIPEGVSATAMEFVVKKSMGEDLMLFPKDRTMPAVSFVAAAMLRAYPCGKAK
jgi:hypothetical protein